MVIIDKDMRNLVWYFIIFIGFIFDFSAFGSDIGNSKFNVPYKQITFSPGYHWFAYYDKLECDPSNRYVLAMRTDFEGRSPTDKDDIEIGMIDLKDGCKWIRLGKSSSWGWQQGCQLQFIPKSDSLVIWNDRIDGKFVSKICDIKTGKTRILPSNIYALSPDGTWALTLDFARVNDTRPGYGYKGEKDKYSGENAPKESGIWKVDLATGESKLIISLAQAAAIPNPYDPDFCQAKHWFNHILVSPDGKRFIFLHRWKYSDLEKSEKYSNVGGFGTRMFTADADGKNLRVIDPYNFTSHFIWEDEKHIVAWTKVPGKGFGFFRFEDAEGGKVEQVGKGVMDRNGHNTFIGSSEWILNDTYPDKMGFQTVYIYNTKTGMRRDLAKLKSPKAYSGEWRCDLHPRSTQDGKFIFIDSAHENGRQIYMLYDFMPRN